MKVQLHIERLVIEGVSPGQARRIGASLERELSRLIAEGGLPQSWGGAAPLENQEIPRLDAGFLEKPAGEPPQGLGSRLAHQLYRGGNGS